MANQEREPFVLDFPNGQRVEDILKKADADYSKAEIDQQMASKATMSDVQRETQNLQNQINEIVRAPESGGDVAAEVYQARVGADGTSYPTLKARLDSEENYNSENIEEVQENVDTLCDIVGVGFLPKSKTKTLAENSKHFLEVGDLVNGKTYTFTFTINKAAAKPVYFTIKNDSAKISTRNIAAGDTTHTFTYTADGNYNNVYISVTLYEPLTISVSVTATGFDTDRITEIENTLSEYSNNIGEINGFIDDISTDASIYTDVTAQANNHSNAFVSWYSLTPTETKGWQYLTLEVSAGETYTITSYGGSNARNWIFAVEDTIVDYCKESTQAERTVDVTITENGILYVNNNYTLGYTANIKKKETRIGIDGEKVYLGTETIDEKLTKSNVLYNKILCCCGDSITYGDDMDSEGFTDTPDIDVYQWSNSQWTKKTSNVRMPWGYQIASRNGMTFYNGGVNGSTMQGMSDHNGFSLENGRYTQLPNDIDYLVIFFGWNDTAYGFLGTINDDTNESYYGGYNVVIPYLQNKYPYTKICLVVPFGCDADHRNAIRLLANKWGLACFDMYGAGTPLYYGKEADVGVNADVVTANREKYQANGAHPNYKGHKQIADMLENFLRGI